MYREWTQTYYQNKRYNITQKDKGNIGRPRKRWRDQFYFEDQGTGNTPYPSWIWWWRWWWWWDTFVFPKNFRSL